jgi:excisionase family DNA binding protein
MVSKTSAGEAVDHGVIPASAVLTAAQAARLLGISLVTAYEAINRGEIPSFRIGRKIIIPRAAFDQMMATARRPCSALQSETEDASPFKRTKTAKHRPGELKERVPT